MGYCYYMGLASLEFPSCLYVLKRFAHSMSVIADTPRTI